MDYVDVIVGALIGLIVSLITSLIAHSLEIARNKQARKWQVEDRQSSQLSDLMKERISQIEMIVNNLRDAIITIVETEIGLLVSTKEFSSEAYRDVILSESSAVLVQILNNLENIPPKELSINSDEGNKLLHEYNEKTSKISSVIFDAIKSAAPLSSFDDENLVNDFQKLSTIATSELRELKRLVSVAYEGEKIDISNFNSRVQRVLLDMFSVYGSFIRGLDKKRIV